MPCYTRVEIIEDTTVNRRARKKLGLPAEGGLSAYDARRVKVEAGVLKAQVAVQRISPGAVVRRTGNKLTISVGI